jgi:hypothetical protein
VDSFKDKDNGMISASSICWFLRQSGFIQLDSVSTRSLVEHLELIMFKLSDHIPSSSNPNQEMFIQAENLPMVITHLLCKVKHISYQAPAAASGDRRDELFSSYALFLSYHLPSAFFVLNHQSILMKGLPILYHIHFLRRFNLNYSVWEDTMVSYSKYRVSLESSTEAIQADATMGWTMQSFIDHCKSTTLIPQFISENHTREICKFVVWPYSTQGSRIETMSLTFSDLLETLFLISQHSEVSMDDDVAYRKLYKVMIYLQKSHRESEEETGDQPAEVNPRPSRAIESSPPNTKTNQTIQAHILALDESFSLEAYHRKTIISSRKIDEIMMLLALYPSSSTTYSYCPWHVAPTYIALKNEITRLSKIRLSAHDDIKSILLIAIEHVCESHQLNSQTVLNYLRSRYADGLRSISSSSDDWYQSIVENQLLDHVSEAIDQSMMCFDEEVLRLLEANAILLQHEYCRIFSHHQDDSFPDLGEYIIPYPVLNHRSLVSFFRNDTTRNQSISQLVPSQALINWALDSTKLSKETAAGLLRSLKLLTSTGDRSDGMSFAFFIIYAIRCYSHQMSSTVRANSKSLSKSKCLDGAGELLKQASQHLSKLQQSLRLRILDPMFGMISSSSPYLQPSSILDQSDRNLVIHTIAYLFKQYHERTSSSLAASSATQQQARYLPPRPPSMLWDAPRFLEFLKFCGLTCAMHADSYIKAWTVYGINLRTSNPPGIDAWSSEIVPPLPMLQDVPTLVKLLEGVVNSYGEQLWSSNPSSDGSSIGLQVILGKVLLPFICAIIRTKKTKSLPPLNSQLQSLQSISCGLEDIFRYGGDQLVKKLEALLPWLQESFDNIAYDTAEASVIAVYNFLSAGGLIPSEIIAASIQMVLHPRARHIDQITMSMYEFQDLFIRCALLAWEISGAAGSSTASSSSFLSQYRDVKKPFKTLPFGIPWRNLGLDARERKSLESVADLYCQYCHRVISEQQKHDDDVHRRTWGVDFITPYYQLLRCQTSSTMHDPIARDVDRNQVIDESSLEHEIKTNDMMTPPRTQTAICSSSSTRTEQQPTKTDPVPDAVLDSLSTTLSSFEIASSSSASSLSTKSSQALAMKSLTKIPTIDNDLELVKETLWSAYATYCSCGDSSEPGKLSGPNLFALLSKLGVLSDETLLSDIGILLHQISSHTNATTLTNSTSSSSTTDSPSLTFEEFMIFLCAFSELRYENSISAPLFVKSTQPELLSPRRKETKGSKDQLEWYREMQAYIATSRTYRRLLEECIQPVLLRHPLLASPEDARTRDKYSLIFSLEVLLAIEATEKRLQSSFQYFHEELLHMTVSNPNSPSSGNTDPSADHSIDIIVYPLQQMNLVPQIMDREKICRLIDDLIPSKESSSLSPPNTASAAAGIDYASLQMFPFPYREWIIAVIAHKAVDRAVSESYLPTDPQVRKYYHDGNI